MRLCVVALMLMLVAGVAYGAGIDGKWEGEMDMMGQAMTLGFTFKTAGATLTGTSMGPGGEELDISDGKIDGDDISFAVKVTGQMEMTVKYKGKIAGEEIKLTMEMDMGGAPGGGAPGGGGPGGGMPPMELVLKRVK